MNQSSGANGRTQYSTTFTVASTHLPSPRRVLASLTVVLLVLLALLPVMSASADVDDDGGTTLDESNPASGINGTSAVGPTEDSNTPDDLLPSPDSQVADAATSAQTLPNEVSDTGVSDTNAADSVAQLQGIAQPLAGSVRRQGYEKGGALPAGHSRSGSAGLTCSENVVYGLDDNGQIYQFERGRGKKIGTVADNLPEFDSGDFDGFAIHPWGGYAYAFVKDGDDRDAKVDGIYKFEMSSGWSFIPNTRFGPTGTNLNAGAFHPHTGMYYIGGFTDDGIFKVFEYNPVKTPSFQLKATVATRNENRNSDGDMTFTATGDLIILGGDEDDNIARIYTVRGDDFSAATGTDIPYVSRDVIDTDHDDASGITFDAQGKGFLAFDDERDIYEYDQPGWRNGSHFVNDEDVVNNDLTGLDTGCYAPTITLEKEIIGNRFGATDQFVLQLKQDSRIVGETTTIGNDSGVQKEKIGPLIATRGAQIEIRETATIGTDLGHYSTDWLCAVDGNQFAYDDGYSGTFTFPSAGNGVTCRITNRPPVATVEITKQVQDSQGSTSLVAKDWTVGMESSGGQVQQNPTDLKQKTDDNGRASWTLKFGDRSETATIKVSETQKANHRFESGTCKITNLRGSVRTVDLTSEASTSINGIESGDKVECTYVNAQQPGAKLTLYKQLEHPVHGDGYAEPTDWTLTATGQTPASGIAASISGVSGATEVTSQTLPAGDYTITELYSATNKPAGIANAYMWTGFACVDANGSTPTFLDARSGNSIDSAIVTLTNGADISCTLTNTAKTGSVTWQKTDDSNNPIPLKGSEWSVSGPGAQAWTVSVSDCTNTSGTGGAWCETTADGTGFHLHDLPWGEYSLVETRAPAGHYPATTNSPITFVIGYDGTDFALERDLGNLVNARRNSPNIPLTGGLSRDALIISGASILLLGGCVLAAATLRARQQNRS